MFILNSLVLNSDKMYEHKYVLTGALGLHLKISRLFCVAPITVTPNGIKYSRNYGILSRFIVLALTIIMLVGFSVDLSDTEHSIRGHSITSRAVWITNITLITAITFVGVYDARGRFKSVIHALNMIEKLKYKIGAKKRSEREEFMTLYVCYVLISILVALNEYTDISKEVIENYDVKLIVMISTFSFGYLTREVLLLQFTLLAAEVKNLLKQMNDKLQDIKDKLDRESTLFSNKIKSKNINRIIDSMTMEYNRSEKEVNQKYTQSVRELVDIYSSICDIIERLGTKHEPLLLLLLGSFFLYIVVIPYYQIFSNIYNLIDNPFILLLRVAWFIFNLANLAIFLEPCHQTQVEIQRTRLLISQLFRRVHTYDTLYEELNVFYRVLMLKITVYSPYSLCILDRPLIVTIMGVVTTYLVIIFQFRSPNDK